MRRIKIEDEESENAKVTRYVINLLRDKRTYKKYYRK